ncbi:MAG: helix-hairpin-helix domain-containing protein [Nitrospinota bacterium]
MDNLTKEFQKIPGIEKSLSKELIPHGFKSISHVKHENPERMYLSLCNLQGKHIDKCVLYVFRCAVYFATKPNLQSVKIVEMERPGF